MTITSSTPPSDSSEAAASLPIPFNVGTPAIIRSTGERVTVYELDGVTRRKVTRTDSPAVWIKNAEGKSVLNRESVPLNALVSAATLDLSDTPLAGAGAHIKPGSGFVSSWRDSRMSVTILTPPADPLTTDQAQDHAEPIETSQLEMEVGQAKDDLILDLQGQVTDRERRIESLEHTLNREREAHKTAVKQRDESQQSARDREQEALIAELSHDLDKANTFYEAEIATLKTSLEQVSAEAEILRQGLRDMQQEGPTAKRKIEIKTLKQLVIDGSNHDVDTELAAYINADWEILDLAVTECATEGYMPITHRTVTLKREVQAPPPPPQDEAHEGLPTLADLFANRTSTISSRGLFGDDQPVKIIFHTDTGLVSTNTAAYEPIDPAEIDLSQPLASNVHRYGARAVGQAQDLQIAAGMNAVRVQWSARFNSLMSQSTSRPFPSSVQP